MKYFYPQLHTLHNPSIDLSDGLPGYKHLEVASRVRLVLNGALSAYDAEVVSVDSLGCEAVREIHDDDYVDFLVAISKEIEDDAEYVPPLFRANMKKSPLFFQGGMYSSEIGTPIGKESITAAFNSAQCALEAAKYLCVEQKNAFAFTRPPGHHAGVRRYGGYCFFNNAYLGANHLVQMGKRVAVIDIDYHIGDGSMEFATKDMPYFSLHANVHRNYPYFDAEFTNENEFVTLKEFQTGISGEEYVREVECLINDAVDASFDVVVLSLGFDTLETDYTQDEYIYVKPENFRTLGELFGALEQEVLILLEGGYDSEYLELCSHNFVNGFVQRKGL